MPWGLLSLNVNSGKTWWSTVLLSIAPDCPCHNVIYDRGFLWWNDFNPMKIGKNPLGSWIQGSAGSAGSWAFSRNFGLLKKTELNRTWNGDIIAIIYNRNKWCISLILVRIWNQRKRWLGSWHMSACKQMKAMQRCIPSTQRVRLILSEKNRRKMKLFMSKISLTSSLT